MGVDAEILVKIKRKESWLTADQLRKASSQLTATIGKDKFFLRPEENKHALYFTEDVWREYADEEIPPGAPVVYQQDGDDIVAEPAEHTPRACVPS